MSEAPIHVPMQTAFEDLFNRTLSRIPNEIGRLIYLASTRDYNSGTYLHEGLATRYSSAEASEALKAAHRQVFEGLAALPLEELVEELEAYIRSSDETRGEFLRAWRELEPYRVAIPIDSDPTMAQLLVSNIRVGLEVLRIRLKQAQERRPGAWRLPSPAR
jgi:hypothetical protein